MNESSQQISAGRTVIVNLYNDGTDSTFTAGFVGAFTSWGLAKRADRIEVWMHELHEMPVKLWEAGPFASPDGGELP